MAPSKESPLRFAPVIIVSLAIILFGLYRTYYPIFSVRPGVVANYYNTGIQPKPNVTEPATTSAKLMPTVTERSKKIEQAILNTKCQIEIVTEKKIFNVTSEGLMGDCNNEPFGKIANSGEILAFEAIFGTKPNLIKLFLLEYEKTAGLGSWREGEIQDFIFLPDDTLIVMMNLSDKVALYAYDINQIRVDFPVIYNSKTGYINNGKRQGRVEFNFENATGVEYKNGKINLLTSEKTVLESVTPEEIYFNSILYTISPAKALEMAVNYHIDQGNIKPAAEFNRSGSSETAWRIDIKNAGDKIGKQYMVNNKTGKIE